MRFAQIATFTCLTKLKSAKSADGKMRNLYKKNQMTLKEIERFMDAKRKREAKTRENLKRIGKAAAIAVIRQRMPNIV